MDDKIATISCVESDQDEVSGFFADFNTESVDLDPKKKYGLNSQFV